MAKHSVIRTPRGIDFEYVKVGRPCIQPRGLEIADMVHHIVQMRRKRGMSAVYQVDQGEVATPTRDSSGSIPAHSWRYLTGPNTRYVRCDVLTLGAVSGSGDPYLTLQSSTDGTGQSFAWVVDAAAPGGVIADDVLQLHSAIVEVSPSTLETISVQQNNTTSLVRILSAVVHEHPIGSVDTTDDAVAIALNNYSAGTNIIYTEYDDLPVGVQSMRRYGKKLLFSSAKEWTTTATPSTSREDFTSRVAGNPPATLHQWDIYPSVNLPETAAVAATAVVLAKASASSGNVRFDLGSTDIDVTAITALGLYSQTGTLAKSSDTLSLQGWSNAAATLTVYGAWLWEDEEAA